jgi:hypothetical protein
MTGKDAFTDEEWKAISEGPATAGMLVLTAEHGGTFRETFALAKGYVEAREQQGTSEVLDAIVSEHPQFDRHRFGSEQALQTEGVDQLREAASALQAKGTPEDVQAYRAFVIALAQRVAAAHKEGDVAVSPAEQQAIDQISAALAEQAA